MPSLESYRFPARARLSRQDVYAAQTPFLGCGSLIKSSVGPRGGVARKKREALLRHQSVTSTGHLEGATLSACLRSSAFFSPRCCSAGIQGSGPETRASLVSQEFAVGSQFTVHVAQNPDELLACATLRAQCFCAFPRGCSPDIQQRQRRVRAEEESEILQLKVHGHLAGFPRTACLIGTVPIPSDSVLPAEELPLLLPGQGSTNFSHSSQPQSPFAVGTLDLNLGLILPGEALVGELPKILDSTADTARTQRAYISNVCVAPSWRKLGLASRLVKSAEEQAQDWGVTDLYIHVEIGNIPARRVYDREGFVVEKVESAATARMFCRKPRLLLHKHLPEARP